jgi:ClpP class serine protease
LGYIVGKGGVVCSQGKLLKLHYIMEPSVVNPIYSLLSLIFWFIFFFLFLTPALRRYSLNKAREALISTLEEKRNSRVITLIHRQESVGFFGIPFIRYINIED